MTNLGDYIGHLVSEMTIARMQADLEAVRVAELYASHPLLKHLPVPHFRMPDVEIEVPVLISEVPEAERTTSPRGGADPQKLRGTFDRVLDEVLLEERVTLTPDRRAALVADLDRVARVETGPQEVAVDVGRFATAMTDLTVRAVQPARGPAGVPGGAAPHALPPTFQRRLKDRTMQEFLKLSKPPPRLGIVAMTSALREVGKPEDVTRIRLKISESGFEWTQLERDGATESRLIEE